MASPKTLERRAAMPQPAPKQPQRIGIRVNPDTILYYDIDAAGTVYWLQPRGDHFQRRLVRDGKLAEYIRKQCSKMASMAPSPSSKQGPGACPPEMQAVPAGDGASAEQAVRQDVIAGPQGEPSGA